MTLSIVLDSAGRFVLPKAIRERLHLTAGAKMKLEVIANKIQLTPEPNETVRIVKKGGIMVLSGCCKNFDAVRAIKTARNERDKSSRTPR